MAAWRLTGIYGLTVNESSLRRIAQRKKNIPRCLRTEGRAASPEESGQYNFSVLWLPQAAGCHLMITTTGMVEIGFDRYFDEQTVQENTCRSASGPFRSPAAALYGESVFWFCGLSVYREGTCMDALMLRGSVRGSNPT